MANKLSTHATLWTTISWYHIPMKIILLGEPKSTQTIYKYTCRGRFANMYMSAKGKEVKRNYQEQVAKQYTGRPLEGAVVVSARFFFGTRRKCDLDNFNKLMADSLTGIVWVDDSQIEELHLYKDFDKDNPRIELTLEFSTPLSRQSD